MGDPATDTVAGVLRDAGARLRKAGTESPDLDARLLLSRTMGKDAPWLIANRDTPVTPATRDQYAALLSRRVGREPMSQILGEREFWSRSFEVTADVLPPRPDSETLIETVLAAQPDRNLPLRILDLGTGTGCLFLTMLSELPSATGLGVDVSGAALAVAQRNAAALDLTGRTRWIVSDWCADVSGLFDIIVSNPPYIETAALAHLDRDVSAFEPHLALDGGADGLACYRAILAGVGRVMTARTQLVFEIGEGQQDAVTQVAETAGLRLVRVTRDLADRVRVLVFEVAAGC